MFEPILLKRAMLPRSETIDVYLANGGYQALLKALHEYSPTQLIDLVKRSKLRGRGGAGFPAGLKWGFVTQDDVPKYLCVNTDEGEPGTFKDRELVEKDPHQIIEGAIIAAYAVGAQRAFVYIRGEFFVGVKRWIKAITDAYARGFLGKNILGSSYSLDMSVHRGAGAYICGEETAMIESLEGHRGAPRLKPPYPAQIGYLGQPTLVHNVETLANVPHIVNHGADWYASIGTEKSTGPKVFCVSGHVYRRGVYELPLGTPLKEILYQHAGGVPGGMKIKAVIPGGASTLMLTADELDVAMDFESLAEKGSALGTGAIIVLDENTCIVDVARRTARFFAHESCGHCTPCRVGSQRMVAILERIEAGRGEPRMIDQIAELCEGIVGRTFCPMGDALVSAMRGSLKFVDEYRAHIAQGRCPFTRWRPTVVPSRRHTARIVA
jgi:NADH-quinone oxidoreductase subunit F